MRHQEADAPAHRGAGCAVPPRPVRFWHAPACTPAVAAFDFRGLRSRFREW